LPCFKGVQQAQDEREIRYVEDVRFREDAGVPVRRRIEVRDSEAQIEEVEIVAPVRLQVSEKIRGARGS